MLTYRRINIDGQFWYHTVHGHLTIGAAHAHPHAYEIEVQGVLERVWGNLVGRIVMDRLVAGAGARVITIVPYTGARNAITSSGAGALSVAVGGTGAGSNVRIAFSASMFRNMGGAGNNPAAALCHELLHALRNSRGHNLNTTPSRAYDFREEFYAVTVENMFNAYAGGVLLRSNHAGASSGPRQDGHHRMVQDPFDWIGENQFVSNQGQERALPRGAQTIMNQVFGPVSGGRTQADQLFTQYAFQLGQLVDEEPDLCQLLAQVHCRGYNPIAVTIAANPANHLPAPPPMPWP